MRLSAKSMTIVFALLWGAGILLVGLIHLAIPSYEKPTSMALARFIPGFMGRAASLTHLWERDTPCSMVESPASFLPGFTTLPPSLNGHESQVNKNRFGSFLISTG